MRSSFLTRRVLTTSGLVGAALAGLSACRPAPPADPLAAAQAFVEAGDSAGAVRVLGGQTSPTARIALAALVLREDPARAGRLLDSAEAAGSHRAAYLGGYWSLMRREGDSLRAMGRVRRAAEAGDADAQFVVHLAFRDGRHGYPADRDSAHAWLDRAARSGNEFAQRDRRALEARSDTAAADATP